MTIGGLFNIVKLAGSAGLTVAGGLSPAMIGLLALGAVTVIGGAFGAGMIVEARWSENLIVTRAEEAKDRAIAALNKRVSEQAQAAEQDASNRAQRESDLDEQVGADLAKAEELASDKKVLPKALVEAIDAAGDPVRSKGKKR